MGITQAVAELTASLGKNFSRSKGDLAAHSASESHFAAQLPDGVVFPGSVDDLVEIVGICERHECPVIGWGAGTSLEGNALAIRGGIAVDFSRMNQVLAVNAEDMNVVVQPGITREDLNSHLRDTGLFFPVDPGANASIGGMAATRASGTTAVRYGTMRDNVLGCQVVLADGRVIRCGRLGRA